MQQKELPLTCNNCDSEFTLLFVEDEVAFKPTHCPFCGDSFEEEELDFNDDSDEDEDEDEDLFDDDDEDEYPDE